MPRYSDSDRPANPPSGSEEPGVEVFTVTDEMARAGELELREKTYGQPLREVAVDVFWAMWAARKSS